MDFDDRYSPHWKLLCAIAHRSTNGRCCWCLTVSSSEVHHIRYQDERGPIAGRELPGVDIFPVCDQCHTTLHSQKYWLKDPQNPVLGNHQKEAATAVLQAGFQVLSNA